MAAAAASLGERIAGTLALAESRGYNLTLENLSTRLLGGPAPVEELREAVLRQGGLDFDGTFVGLRGRLRTEKCARRKEANGKWLPLALTVAQEYARDLVRLCPHVRCVMLAGSAASEGFCPEDDIDLNIVVRDGTKYTSYVTAALLSLQYSLRYGRKIGSRYMPGVPKVICINVVWEDNQAIPFARRDGQLAFELLNSVVLYNQGYYRRMLAANAWMSDFFPQMFAQNCHDGPGAVPEAEAGHGRPSRAIERISRRMLFAMHGIVWGLRATRPDLRERMVLVEKVKRPYGIFDDPHPSAEERT